MKTFALKSLGVLLAGGLFAASASAAEVQVTMVPGKSGTSFAMDLTNARGAVGFNFKINLPGAANPKAVNLSKCTADLQLAKGWSGSCSAKENAVYVYATQGAIQPLAEDMLSIGTISVSGWKQTKKAGAVTVEELFVSDAKGNPIETQAKVNVE